MSREPSRSPAPPGASEDTPVWFRETTGGNDRMLRNLDLAIKVVVFAYTLMSAWQIAKMLNPPLQVKQDMAVRALRLRLARPSGELPELSHADRAAIYDDTR
jgi:hypothetical protein